MERARGGTQLRPMHGITNPPGLLDRQVAGSIPARPMDRTTCKGPASVGPFFWFMQADQRKGNSGGNTPARLGKLVESLATSSQGNRRRRPLQTKSLEDGWVVLVHLTLSMWC